MTHKNYVALIKGHAEELKGLTDGLKSGAVTGEEATRAVSRVQELTGEIRGLQAEQSAATAGDEVLGNLAKSAEQSGKADAPRSLGEHVAQGLKSSGFRVEQRRAVDLGEFKAATTALVTGGAPGVGTLTELDVQQNVVSRDNWIPTVGGLFAQGTVSGTGLKYFVETPVEGAFDAVAELGHKPQLSMGYVPEMEALGKIAGFIKESDEFLEDLPYLASVTNGRLLRSLAQKEESQLVAGSGTGANMKGLLNRTGLQTLKSTAPGDNAAALFRALMSVQNVTGLLADGIVINPADYERERLTRDGNGQFFGGGPFTGAYGQGGTPLIAPLWGTRTVVSSAVPVGTAVVGAFGSAAMLFRKGGVRVDIANQNADDFEYNRVTIRAEERVGLAVYVPQAFAKVTLAAAAA